MFTVATIAWSPGHSSWLGAGGLQQCHDIGCLSLSNGVFRSFLRRYPNTDDQRAALAAAEWELGQYERAEGDWSRVQN